MSWTTTSRTAARQALRRGPSPITVGESRRPARTAAAAGAPDERYPKGSLREDPFTEQLGEDIFTLQQHGAPWP
jgi:hypothetical protein